MTKVIFFLYLFVIPVHAFAADNADIQTTLQKGDCAAQAQSAQWLDAQNQTSPITAPPVSPAADEEERRGCCSHHGGVCGCSNNRALCCDGKLSPTCGCD